jgi:hypothetical protein
MAYVFCILCPLQGLGGCRLSNNQPQIEYAGAVTAGETAHNLNILGETT